MTERTLTDADIDALCEVLVPKIEAKLSERFYASAGRGMFGWVIKLWQPLLIAAILYGWLTRRICRRLWPLRSRQRGISSQGQGPG